MNLYTYVNFAEDEAKKPKKKSFLRKHWKKLALGAAGAVALTGLAMHAHDMRNVRKDLMEENEKLRHQEKNPAVKAEISRLESKIATLEHLIAQLSEKIKDCWTGSNGGGGPVDAAKARMLRSKYTKELQQARAELARLKAML